MQGHQSSTNRRRKGARGAPSIVLLGSVDPVLRGSASFAAVTDVPGTVVVTQDIDPYRDRPIHRHIADASGVLVDGWVQVEHACATCALREDTIPSLGMIVAEGRYSNIVLAAPVGVETLPIARAVEGATRPGGAAGPGPPGLRGGCLRGGHAEP